MTWAEQRLWKELRKLNANFRRQAPIGRYFADFAYHAGRLVVEVDGEVHERLADVALRDIERQRWLEGEGYRVLRFSNGQVRHQLAECVDAIKVALLLDGGGLGGGEATAFPTEAPDGAGAKSSSTFAVVATPPSPTLPPSRRKGE